MKIRSLNNPAIEKDYQLLKLIEEQLIAIQPLIQQVACLSIIEEHGSHIIDHDGKLKLASKSKQKSINNSLRSSPTYVKSP